MSPSLFHGKGINTQVAMVFRSVSTHASCGLRFGDRLSLALVLSSAMAQGAQVLSLSVVLLPFSVFSDFCLHAFCPIVFLGTAAATGVTSAFRSGRRQDRQSQPHLCDFIRRLPDLYLDPAARVLSHGYSCWEGGGTEKEFMYIYYVSTRSRFA